MSNVSSAPNDIESARKYVQCLVRSGCFEKILLAGSRCPLREKQPHENSDWDLVGISKIKHLKFVNPRTGNRLHADLLILTPEQASHYEKTTVEIWPNDTHGVLT